MPLHWKLFNFFFLLCPKIYLWLLTVDIGIATLPVSRKGLFVWWLLPWLPINRSKSPRGRLTKGAHRSLQSYEVSKNWGAVSWRCD